MKGNTTKPTGESNSDKEENEEMSNNQDLGDDAAELEFEALNSQLDELNSALDTLEQRNDDIQAQLRNLLQSNRAVRLQFQSAETENPKPK